MASYKILFTRSAEKELRKIPSPHLARIVNKINALSHEPRPLGAQMLKGEERYFRLRQGDYRIIYDVSDLEQRIIIIKVGHRREVYESS